MFQKRSTNHCIGILILSALVIPGVVQCYANQPVSFADPALKAAVEEWLSISDPTPMDMLELDYFWASDMQITDLTGLEYALRLEDLDLEYNFIADLSPISGLKRLTELWLTGNQIDDLSPLSQLTKLNTLFLGENYISDISALAQLKRLRTLGLTDNYLADISILSHMTNLTDLQLSYNHITDISGLSQLTKLETLSLSENNIVDVSTLSQLKNLTDLLLASNQISDISALSQLTNLTDLWLAGNHISNISALSGLTNLTELWLAENHVSDISAVSRLTNLTDLWLFNNEISNISPLSQLTNLTQLSLAGNRITTISALADLLDLAILTLQGNQIVDISPLRQLTNLNMLVLADNLIVDLSPLHLLTKLTHLSVEINALSEISYCTDIPLIRSNNPHLVWFKHDPIPPKCVQGQQARTIFVNPKASAAFDGSSWYRPLRYLQDALDVARYGDEIRVAQGICRPDLGDDFIPGDPNASFQLNAGVTLRGGFAGLGVMNNSEIEVDPNHRDMSRFETILSGDLLGNDDGSWRGDGDDPAREDNARRVVSVDYSDSATVLDGFTVSGGHAYTSFWDDDYRSFGDFGGGIGVTNIAAFASLSIFQCTFMDNYAHVGGGGIYCVDVTLVDCDFINNHAGIAGGGIKVSSADVKGCLFRGNSAGDGGSGADTYGHVKFSDCLFAENSSERAAGAIGVETDLFLIDRTDPFNDPNIHVVTLDTVTIQGDVAAPYEANAGYFQNNIVRLTGDFDLETGQLDVLSVLFEGGGSVNIAEQAGLRVVGGTRSYPTVVKCIINGPGYIEIDHGTQLILDANSVVNLSGSKDAIPDPCSAGRITVKGSLVVQGHATLEGTNVDVYVLDANSTNDIKYNNIRLVEASTGFGGELFVTEHATIRQNNIVSEGDRYLDLDPDPKVEQRPTITQNRISVIIKEGTLGSQGTLLELRAKDYEGIGDSGAFRVSADNPGFTDDPSENWVLESLSLQAHAKLNLTNRQGFRYQDPLDPFPETVYVKELVLGPHSVLNTALQTLYYQDLVIVDSNGHELARNPASADLVFVNGAQFTDIPLLGFSLGVIAMNDTAPSPHNEFDIRVRQRLVDPNDQQPDPNDPTLVGSIELIRDDPAIPAGHGGVMEMRTQAPGKQSASSIAAKGAFSRAGDEEITVEFDYLFLADPDGQAELIVYLSDHPEVSRDHQAPYEIARIFPPVAGRPGSVGSGKFAFFSGTFSRNGLNFTRGTYVELELRGAGARCWIDNWDPQVSCTAKCGDFDPRDFPQGGVPGINVYDYLVMLSEFGLTDSYKRCLDMVTDGCVNMDDLMNWEIREELNRCPALPATLTPSAVTSRSIGMFGLLPDLPDPSSTHPLRISGKPYAFAGGTRMPSTVSYDVSTEGVCAGPGTAITPVASGYGRLVTDSQGHTYQLHSGQKLIHSDTGDVVLASSAAHSDATVFSHQDLDSVLVGLVDKRGLPLLDVAFDPGDADIVYVVPVLVNDSDSAAAKLRLERDAQGYTGRYDILALFVPTASNVVTYPEHTEHFSSEPDFQHLHEIEVGSDGLVYILSSHTGRSGPRLVGNSWLLVFDGQGGSHKRAIDLHTMGLVAPTAMAVSSGATEKHLYFASSQVTKGEPQQLAAQVYSLPIKDIDSVATEDLALAVIDINCPAPVFCDTHAHLYDPNEGCVAAITSISTHPSKGHVYVTGFVAPRFSSSFTFPVHQTKEFFTTPIFATIPPDGPIEPARIITHADLALPMSMVWALPDE
jgi:predicted outer membrane repeat protein